MERENRSNDVHNHAARQLEDVCVDGQRNAFRKQAGQSKTQDVYEQAARNWSRRVWYPWNQRWIQPTRAGRAAAKNGKFKDEQTWGKECFEDLVGQQKGWKVEQLVFVGGTCGSVNVVTFNQNLKLLEVPEGKWSRLRQRMARQLLEEQDTLNEYQ